MREILFRGKKHSDGQWILGDLNQWLEAIYISAENSDGYTKTNWLVDAATVGQFTGLTDKNGVKIFEGDIVENNECLGVVEYSEEDAMYTVMFDETLYDFGWIGAKMCEVIGNIHDNPELLKGGAASGSKENVR